MDAIRASMRAVANAKHKALLRDREEEEQQEQQALAAVPEDDKQHAELGE